MLPLPIHLEKYVYCLDCVGKNYFRKDSAERILRNDSRSSKNKFPIINRLYTDRNFVDNFL